MGVVQSNADLQQHNLLRLRAVAGAYAKLGNLDQLGDLLRYARREHRQLLPLGDGSNVVLGDLPEHLVIEVANQGIKRLRENDNEVWVEVAAGENWHQWVSTAIDNGWHGLENLALIPGRVGAAPIQNIGAYGVEVEQFIDSVQVVDLAASGDAGPVRLHLQAADCGFGYRDSRFKGADAGRFIVLSVTFRLHKQFAPALHYQSLAAHLSSHAIDEAALTPRQLFDAVVAIRTDKLPDPARQPNAGSFFKNPLIDAEAVSEALRPACLPTAETGRQKLSAAWLIEQAGFKGKRDGNVGMSNQHALVLVNYGEDTRRADVLAFAAQVQAAVQSQFGVALDMEPAACPRAGKTDA